MATKPFTFGSLFAGIGGLDLGLERAGMTCKWQVEIDDYATRVLEKHWPHVRRYRDVRECGAANLEPVDLICGGFPCQPFSLAGKRRGTGDDRYLWPEMARIIAELRPRWVLGENVPGIFVHLDTVLADLERQGYEARAVDLPAVAFDAPHLRQRTFIVAHRDEPGLAEYQGQRSNSPSQLPAIVGSGRIVAHADAGGLRTDERLFQGQSNSGERSAVMADAHNGNGHRRAGDVQVGRLGYQEETQADGLTRRTEWLPEPAICELADGVSTGLVRYRGRVATGVPHRLEKLRCLGNAVVPQVAEFVGRLILKAEETQ